MIPRLPSLRLRKPHTAALLLVVLTACTPTRQEAQETAARDTAQTSTTPPASMPTQTLRAEPPAFAWPRDSSLYAIDANDSADARIPRCREQTPAVTPDSLGPVRAGMRVEELRAACPEVFHGWEWDDLGRPAPALAVRLGDALVTATVDRAALDGRITAVATASRAARTGDGFGPGSRLGALEDAWGRPRLHEGECLIDATFARHPGLVFRLDLPPEGDCADIGALARRGAVHRLPDGITVRRVTQKAVAPD